MNNLNGVQIWVSSKAASEDLANVGMELMKRQLIGEIESKSLTLLSKVKTVMNGPNTDLITGQAFWSVAAYARVAHYE